MILRYLYSFGRESDTPNFLLRLLNLPGASHQIALKLHRSSFSLRKPSKKMVLDSIDYRLNM